MRISPSQVNNYESCPRKWYFQSVCKVYPPTSDALKFGTEFHEAVEAYIKSGEIQTQNENITLMLQNAVKTLEPIRERFLAGETHIEETITGNVLDKYGITYLGKPDLVIRSKSPEGLKEITVLDHKTSKAEQWLKTEEQLSNDTQCNFYMHHFLKENPDRLFIGHVQYLKEGTRGCKITATAISMESHVRVWHEIEDACAKMAALEKSYKDDYKALISNVPMCQQACGAFGGCPFKPVCDTGFDLWELKKNFQEGKKVPVTETSEKEASVASKFFNNNSKNPFPKKETGLESRTNKKETKMTANFFKPKEETKQETNPVVDSITYILDPKYWSPKVGACIPKTMKVSGFEVPTPFMPEFFQKFDDSVIIIEVMEGKIKMPNGDEIDIMITGLPQLAPGSKLGVDVKLYKEQKITNGKQGPYIKSPSKIEGDFLLSEYSEVVEGKVVYKEPKPKVKEVKEEEVKEISIVCPCCNAKFIKA